ncbi:glutathione S-transferase family protein [Arenicella xantha]|uniref:glutathione transferase n=1 Tax=Arenicella xantha TaxID=644221 RepID=A0A395JNT7_9GAMM|nr:glutathione S-transferase [Arenicella xantha]RBP51248.1 glutathione S-transferase [Arenicella xantha]
MLTLHHLEYSQSYRVLWLLEELGATYELKVYERDKQTRLAPADYKAVSPLGTSPVITDGDLNLAETSTIFDYILDQYPESPLRPAPHSAARTDYLFWFHAAQGSMMPMMLMSIVFQMLETRSPRLIRPLIKTVLGKASSAMVKPRMKLLLDKAEADLAATGWFAGDALSAADMMLSYPLESADSKGLLKNDYPNCRAWVQRIKQVSSYQSAKQKDGRPSAVFEM